MKVKIKWKWNIETVKLSFFCDGGFAISVITAVVTVTTEVAIDIVTVTVEVAL